MPAPPINVMHPDQLVERDARREELNQLELLALMSRTFLLPIVDLTEARGTNEADIGPIVATAYNQARRNDQFEDAEKARLSNEEKKTALDKETATIDKVARKGETAIPDVLESADFTYANRMLMQGTNPDNKYAMAFANQSSKGTILRALARFPEDQRLLFRQVMQDMNTGMRYFLITGEIQQKQQLIDYCFPVAGSLGRELLHPLVTKLNHSIPGIETMSPREAEHLGVYLQLTNIGKNIREDSDEGRVYVPREFRRPETSHHGLIHDAALKDQRREVFQKLESTAFEYFPDAVSYIIKIPTQLSGFRSFCSQPLILAAGTWEAMDVAGAEEVFKGTKEAITVRGGRSTVGKVREFVYDMSREGRATEFNKWLEKLKQEPYKTYRETFLN